MGFQELVDSLKSPGEDGPSPSIYDDLTAEYNTAVEGGRAKLDEMGVALEKANGEVARLKALNFDLLTATPAPPPDETPEEEPTPDTQSGIDALFGDKE